MGGYKGGAKGVAKGVGRGLIGVVAKPIAGTVGFFHCTVQGTVNTPGAIRRATTKKKKGIDDASSSATDATGRVSFDSSQNAVENLIA